MLIRLPALSRLRGAPARLPLPLLALGLALAGQLLVAGRPMPWVGGALLVAGGLLAGLATRRAWRESPPYESRPPLDEDCPPFARPSLPVPCSRTREEGSPPADDARASERPLVPVLPPDAVGRERGSPPAAPSPVGVWGVGGLVGGRIGLAALLLVTAAAALCRLPLLGKLPPGLAADEARLGLDALFLLRQGWSTLSWNGWPAFHLATVGSVAALGPTALAVRLPAALAGIALAPALYLLGQQLGGVRLGAVAGLLGAVLFWHADATRAAWGYVAWGVVCEVLGLALLVRAIRQPTPLWGALAGLLFGLALQVSWAALAAMGTGALLAVRAFGAGLAPRRALTGVLAPFLVYFLVAAGPVVIGMSLPDRPLGPAGPAVGSPSAPSALVPDPAETAGSPAPPASLSRPREGGMEGEGLPASPQLHRGGGLLETALRLLLVFNVAGDPSPLHGLRGEPLLDPVTGALLVLGLGAALARWRGSQLPALAAWLVGAIGVAAAVTRPDQSLGLAAMHALAPALLLAASAVSATAGPVWRPREGAAGLPLDLALLALVLVVGVNLHTLYVRRPADSTGWAAFASAEALAAREIQRLAPTHAIYLADVWIDHPTIRFLAPRLTAPRRLDPATTLPLPRDEAFAYFAPGSQEVVTDDLERLYEDGEIDRYRSPLDETAVVVRSFRAPAHVVADARGVTLRASLSERSRATRYTLPAFRAEWPLAGEPPRPASLELFAAVSVAVPGPYRLWLDGPPNAVLELNGVVLGGPGRELHATLAGGTQRLRVIATVEGPSRIELRWTPPGSAMLAPIPRERLAREQRAAAGLLALYRAGAEPSGPVQLARVERYVQRHESPPPVPRPYVVDWVGYVDVPKSGTYQFKLNASGPASLWLDDQPLLFNAAPGAGPVSMVLPDGDHRIQVRLIDTAGPTHLDLLWAPPNEPLTAIPTSRLRPPDAAVDSALPPATSGGTALAPLGTSRVRWLASTEGEPRAVAVRPDSTVVLANVTARQLQQVVGEGRAVAGLPAPLAVPTDVEVGPGGQVWALDAFYGQVVRLGQDGAIERTIENRDLGLYRPRGLAIGLDGTILIADTGGNRIVRLSPDGTPLGTIGPEVGGRERIRQPTDVAVGPDGELFVVNGEGGALLRLTAEGRYERHWTVQASDTERGAHLAIGPDRSVWVSEPEGRRVSRFTFDGTPAGVVDQVRTGRLLRAPVGIAVGPDGTLYVADASLRAVVAIGFQP